MIILIVLLNCSKRKLYKISLAASIGLQINRPTNTNLYVHVYNNSTRIDLILTIKVIEL